MHQSLLPQAVGRRERLPPSVTSQVQTNGSPPPPRASDLSKGKELVIVTSKLTSDGNESDLPRKRPSQGIQLSDLSELQGVAPLTARALALRVSKGEGSSRSSSFPYTKEGFKLLESRRELKGLAQEIQWASPPLSNLQLSNPWVRRFFDKTVLHREMDHDLP